MARRAPTRALGSRTAASGRHRCTRPPADGPPAGSLQFVDVVSLRFTTHSQTEGRINSQVVPPAMARRAERSSRGRASATGEPRIQRRASPEYSDRRHRSKRWLIGVRAPSNMQRLAERLQRRLVERFAFRRVGVDRAGDVLEPRAHFERRADDRSETPAPTAWIPSTTWLPARTAAPWRGGVSPPKVRETRTLRGAQRPRSNSAKFSAERKTTPLAGCNLGRTRASFPSLLPLGEERG